MDASTREALGERFPLIYGPEVEQDASGQVVPAEQHLALATFLKEELGFTLYITVVGVHIEANTYEVATVLRRPTMGAELVRWRVRLEDGASIHSLYSLFRGADIQEREQYDLVGVRFEGHPNLIRLMMPEDWEGHPLRKDYAPDMPHAPWR